MKISIKNIGILPRIIIAIILGICIGTMLPMWAVRCFVTFNNIFSEFLSFCIPLIIVGLVTPAISEIGQGARKLLIITVLLAYGSTIIAGLVSYETATLTFPHFIEGSSSMDDIATETDIAPYFKINIPPLMNVMTALILAFIIGLGLTYIKGTTLKSVCCEFRDIIVNTIESVIIPLLPVYIFGIFLNMTAKGEVYQIITVFIQIIGIIFILHICWLIVLFIISGLLSGKNPFRCLFNMLPAYFTALGTQSSAATIPVTLKQIQKNGVREDIAGFVVPLCATIHLSGSMLKIVACAIALMIMQGQQIDFGTFFGFICLLGITMIAAPGVPGGAIMAALGILETSLGFDASDQALMIALYITMDSFGTACNVTGDGAIALVIDRITKNKEQL